MLVLPQAQAEEPLSQSGLPQKDAGCRENASLWAYLSMCAWDRGLLQALARTEEVKCSPE